MVREENTQSQQKQIVLRVKTLGLFGSINFCLGEDL